MRGNGGRGRGDGLGNKPPNDIEMEKILIVTYSNIQERNKTSSAYIDD